MLADAHTAAVLGGESVRARRNLCCCRITAPLGTAACCPACEALSHIDLEHDGRGHGAEIPADAKARVAVGTHGYLHSKPLARITTDSHLAATHAFAIGSGPVAPGAPAAGRGSSQGAVDRLLAWPGSRSPGACPVLAGEAS